MDIHMLCFYSKFNDIASMPRRLLVFLAAAYLENREGGQGLEGHFFTKGGRRTVVRRKVLIFSAFSYVLSCVRCSRQPCLTYVCM